MSTQMLFYERVTPISSQRHADWSVEAGGKYGFAKGVNSVPLTAIEIPLAAREYTIVFAGNADDAIMPVVILGIEGKKNVYVTDDERWDARYVPAFVRRYPFVFSRSEDGKTFTLCVDESYSGCNFEGRGQRLFEEDGARTKFLENVLGFLREYQNHFQRTMAYTKKLKELDLLEPMRAQFKTGEGESRSLTGFMAVNRDKLKNLEPQALSDLAKTDELELTYAHLNSLNNLAMTLERATGTKSGADAEAREAGQGAASSTTH